MSEEPQQWSGQGQGRAKDPKEPGHRSSLQDQQLRIGKELILIFFWESARDAVGLC